MDHHIGRLLDHLRRSGEFDDTLIVVTADHGDMLGDHYMWGKHSPHEGAIHIPLLIRDPRCLETSGSRVEHFTESIDIAPTLLDWVGINTLLVLTAGHCCHFCEAKHHLTGVTTCLPSWILVIQSSHTVSAAAWFDPGAVQLRSHSR